MVYTRFLSSYGNGPQRVFSAFLNGLPERVAHGLLSVSSQFMKRVSGSLKKVSKQFLTGRFVCFQAVFRVSRKQATASYQLVFSV